MIYQSELFSKNNVVIFGGAFDPITKAHIDLANLCYEKTGCDIWIMPCGAHKIKKELTHHSIRIRMIEESINNNHIHVFDWEIKNKSDGSLYKTLKKIQQQYQSINFKPVIGYDNALHIEQWDNYKKLIDEFSFLVIKRNGYKVLPDLWCHDPKHTIIDFQSDLSSTLVREAVQKNDLESLTSMVSPQTLGVIQQHKLYL